MSEIVVAEDFRSNDGCVRHVGGRLYLWPFGRLETGHVLEFIFRKVLLVQFDIKSRSKINK